MGKKQPLYNLLILLLAAVLLAGCGKGGEETVPTGETSGNAAQAPTEEGAIALPTRYIVLSYPETLKEDVSVSYEEVKDGQKVIFTTDFTGESLELFRFVISKSHSEGHLLGTLKDEQEGEMYVCVNVCEYSQGNWEVADYTRLCSLQERVNDIIVQFHQDPRFVPNRQ